MMTKKTMTPEETEQLRQLLRDYGPQILIFADDLMHLVKMRETDDATLLKLFNVLLVKMQMIDEIPDAVIYEHLKKETGDQPKKPDVTSHRVKRTYGHVVPSKAEQKRRESGGSSGQYGWDHGYADGARAFGFDDDGIPF